MTDSRLKILGRMSASLRTARAEMARGEPSLACLIGVVAAVYSQIDTVKDRWKAADLAAYEAMRKALIAKQDEYSIEDYDTAAETIEATYRQAHKASAVDVAEGVLKYAWVQIALCNSAAFDAVAFAAMMSMIDFYLEPLADFPDYLTGALRGVLFGTISGPIAASDLAAALEYAYTGERAAAGLQSIERGILVGTRVGLTGTTFDTKAVYWYYGPEDEKNRVSFCKQMVDKCYSVAMINQCANGFMTPIWENCGGPNCRHVWFKTSPKALADRKGNGYGIDLTDRIVEGYTLGTAGKAPHLSVFIVPEPPLSFVHIYAPDTGAKH